MKMGIRSFSVIAALAAVLAGCGGGISDGDWYTVLYEDFGMPDGVLDLSAFVSAPADGGDVFSIDSDRLRFQAATTTEPAVFATARFRAPLRVTLTLTKMDSTASFFFGIGILTDAIDFDVNNGLTCSFTHGLAALNAQVAGSSTQLDSGGGIGWLQDPDKTVVLTIDDGQADCEIGSEGDRLSGRYSHRDSGYLGFKTRDTGGNSRIDIDSIRIETR